MRRRDFIRAIASSAIAWPLAARAQSTTPVVGFLSSRSADESHYVLTAFLSGLKELDFVEGNNLAIEYRWAEGRYDLSPTLAADLVRRRVTVIAAGGGQMSALAAKAATSTIPIVFNSGIDPIRLGLVTSINQPGGNATGVYQFAQEIDTKRMALLRELVSNPASIAVLLDPNHVSFQTVSESIEAAARAIGQHVDMLRASSEWEIHAAFRELSQLKPQALLVGADPFFNERREQLVTLANHYGLPAIYELREFAVTGGLMSYGTSLTEAYHQMGVYAGSILRGEKASDLPVVQPTKFELVINLNTAKALGISIPPTLLARADEVIE